MNTRKAFAFLVASGVFALVASGDDSWRKKPYSEWNEKEVRQILENSPWAHRVKLMVVKPGPQDIPCPSGNQHCSADSGPSMTNPSVTVHRRQLSPDDLQGIQDRRTAAALPPGLEGVAAIAVVRWASARTVREALLRSGIQHGQVKPEELQDPKAVAPLDSYVVYVDLRVPLADVKKVPQSGLFTAALVQNSVLVLKSSGARISPLSVKSAPLPAFDERKELALGAFYVYFPRQVGGKPSLPGNETLVRFECPLAPSAITSEFDLQKMAREGAPDL
jgi:hypothetical protein